jgi:16S rRNA (uracil1498-N3)-methyltransferase
LRTPRALASIIDLAEFNSAEDLIGREVEFSKDESHHLVKVLRLSAGDSLEILDIAISKSFSARVIKVVASQVTAKIEAVLPGAPYPITHLLVAVFKLSRLETMLEKCVELGVSSIEFFPSEFKKEGADIEKLEKKLPRLYKIRNEALKQSKSNVITDIRLNSGLEKLLLRTAQKKCEKLLLCPLPPPITCCNLSGFRPIPNCSDEIKRIPKNDDLYIVVGPEGGFSDKELELLINGGFRPVTIGPNILRTETAAIAGLTLAQHLRM